MEEGKEQDDENFDKIKVFSSEDEKLKILGELLSNKSSRDIIKLLIEKEMYTNEIAKKLELRVNLVIHHLRKMESIGLVEINKKKIIRKGEGHRFFRIPQGMLIVPNESNEMDKNRFKKNFKEGIKFAMIGLAAVSSFVILTPQRTNTGTITLDEPEKELLTRILEIEPLTSSLLIIIVGLVLERIFSYLIKRKRKES